MPPRTTPGKRFAFSHLYTALTRPGYRDFLGLGDEWRSEDPQPNPVPKKNLENLQQVLIWLYGSKSDGIKPVITSQNPDLKFLGAVLEQFFAKYVSLNSFTETVIHTQQRKEIMRWPAQVGRRQII